MLPPRIARKAKAETRWRSPAHCSFVRSHACCSCGSTIGIEAAHVRLGSHTGISQKPDDWRVVSLCRQCHEDQHRVGERSFWAQFGGEDHTNGLIDAFCKASPKAADIRRVRQDREAA